MTRKACLERKHIAYIVIRMRSWASLHCQNFGFMYNFSFFFQLCAGCVNLFSPFGVFIHRCVNKKRRPEVSAAGVISVSRIREAKFGKSTFLVARNIGKIMISRCLGNRIIYIFIYVDVDICM